jgi:hypothetical protein
VTGCPMNNVDEFRHRPVNELAALLLDKQAAGTPAGQASRRRRNQGLADRRRRHLDRARCTARKVPTLLIQLGPTTASPRGSSAGRGLEATSHVGGAERAGHPGGRDPSLEVVDDRPGCEHANAKI